MRRTKKKSRSDGKYVVIAVAIILIVIIAVVAVSMTGEPELPKADEYFSISWIGYDPVSNSSGVWGEQYTNSSVIITLLTINITAIEGEATEVIVFLNYHGTSMDSGESVEYKEKLAAGESWEIVVQYENFVAPIKEGKIVLDRAFTVGCRETTEVTVTFKIPLDDLSYLPG